MLCYRALLTDKLLYFYRITKLQPFCYRSYYLDTESNFYYLQSRYYDPVTHRFINADGYVSTGTGILGHNMFAYCNNNPVNCSDPTGCCGDPTCVSCNPERAAFVAERYQKRWYDSVYPGFVPYSCKPTPQKSTEKTKQGTYATSTYSEKRDVIYDLPGGGTATLFVMYHAYEDTNGVNYVSPSWIYYYINGCYSFESVDITIGNSYDILEKQSTENFGVYVVNWEPSNNFVAIGANITIHMQDGSNVRVYNNYSGGEIAIQ